MQRGSRRAAGRHQRHTPAPWFTRVRALLAGALVLGVGATLTLASWTDQEYAGGAFKASTFGIEGSTNGTTWADYTVTSTPASLTFAVNPGAMSPGTTVYSKFLVRTTSGTDITGKVRLNGATATGDLAAALTYGVSAITGSTCDATSFGAGTLVVAAGQALNAVSTTDQTLATNGASSVTYCFAVTLPTGALNSLQGKTANAEWTFTATSDS